MSVLNAQEVYQRLGEPFGEKDIEWRSQQVFEGKNNNPPKALVVPFVQSRSIMNRLDEVVGWDRWENVIEELPGGGIVQGIRIWLSDTRNITKYDGADRTNIESTKGGISSAFKRAGNLFNIGRHLYSEKPQWVEITPNRLTPNDEYISDRKKNIYGYFTPPSLGGTNSNPGRTQQPQGNENLPKNQVPSGMIECTFKGLVDRDSDSGSYLEVWLESGGESAYFYAIGEMRNNLLSLKLQEGNVVAIASKRDESGNFLIDNVVKVSA